MNKLAKKSVQKRREPNEFAEFHKLLASKVNGKVGGEWVVVGW